MYPNPIFLECKEWTLNPIWEKKLEKYARGKSKKIQKISDYEYLINNQKVILSNDSKNNFLIIKDLILKKTRIITEQKNWDQIKSNNEKIFLIINYINECKLQYNLNNETLQKLFATIKLLIYLKLLNNDDFIYENNKIINIIPFKFTNNKFSYSIKEDVPKNKAKNINMNDKLITKYIDKFIKEFENS